MKLFVLTGGIGSGKSSVASRLIDRGALLIDSDLIVRELQQPGGAAFVAMTERWGEAIVTPEGTLNRQAVAQIVFNESAELDALNNIMGPAIRAETVRRTIEAADSGRNVVQDIPLFAESPVSRRPPYSGVVVVDTPPEVAVQRLKQFRGFTEDDARARMAKQSSRDERLTFADFVVDNAGSAEDLDRGVARLWVWMDGCPDVPPPKPRAPKP